MSTPFSVVRVVICAVCGAVCQWVLEGGCSKNRKTISANPIGISTKTWVVFSDFH